MPYGALADLPPWHRMSKRQMPNDILAHIVNLALDFAVEPLRATDSQRRSFSASKALLETITVFAPLNEFTNRSVAIFLTSSITHTTEAKDANNAELHMHRIQQHGDPRYTSFDCKECESLTQSSSSIEDALSHLSLAHQTLQQTIQIGRDFVAKLLTLPDWCALKHSRDMGGIGQMEFWRREMSIIRKLKERESKMRKRAAHLSKSEIGRLKGFIARGPVGSMIRVETIVDNEAEDVINHEKRDKLSQTLKNHKSDSEELGHLKRGNDVVTVAQGVEAMGEGCAAGEEKGKIDQFQSRIYKGGKRRRENKRMNKRRTKIMTEDLRKGWERSKANTG